MRRIPIRRAAARLLAASALVAACSPPAGDVFSPEPFLADLAQLEAFAATTYANLEWAITEGGVDPVALDAEARAAIGAAASDEEARAALRGFVARFGDGHFRLLEPSAGERPGRDAATGPGPESSAAEACAALGYVEHDQSFRVDFGGGFEPLTAEDDPFPAGRWVRPDGARIGIVRIDEFGAGRYGEHCPEVWEAYRRELEGPCAEWTCRYGFRLAMEERLLSEIADRIASLEAAGIDGLAIDLTGNGGGTDWVHAAARLLTGRTLAGNEQSVVRHPHWMAQLEEMAAEVEADLARGDLSRDQQTVLEAVHRRLASGLEQAAAPCDLTAVWERGGADLPCTLLARGALYTTGLLREPPRFEIEGLEIGTSLFKALTYRSRPPAWTGPLALLVDRDTGSASELFTALLRDNGAAVVVGERTDGTGCGHTNGGIQTRLTHSGLEVWLPDCVHHRRDGGNARAGITPDLPAGWERGETPEERGAKLIRALDGWQLSGVW